MSPPNCGPIDLPSTYHCGPIETPKDLRLWRALPCCEYELAPPRMIWLVARENGKTVAFDATLGCDVRRASCILITF